jgi:hypothetical protein
MEEFQFRERKGMSEDLVGRQALHSNTCHFAARSNASLFNVEQCITQNVSKSTITSRRKRQEIISQWLMIDDSLDTSKTEERNGPAHYSGTILAGET